MLTTLPSPPRRPILIRALLPALFAVLAIVASAGMAGAAGGPTMTARVLLQGHARLGAWMGVEVRLRNDGPSFAGEIRLAGGAQGRTTFSTAIDQPTNSDKTYRLYVQPPAFGEQLTVTIVTGNQTIATQDVAFRVHDATQLVVGVVADRPEAIVGGMHLLPGVTGTVPAVFPLAPADLPDRAEAWAPLDRLIWQDVDSSQLSPDQLAALRSWLAGGGRLLIVGGTNGAAGLSAFPDDLLPYRPTATVDVAPSSLTGLLGELPSSAADVPALAGTLARGRPLATAGDRVIAAEAAHGSGAVDILGVDPTVGWLAESKAQDTLWRRVVPGRLAGTGGGGDDSSMVNAVTQLPSITLPPIGGLLLLLGAYILLIGPVNYFVLRRLDRREWAWVTMPVLIVVFAAGAYGYGAALRGVDVIVNEVAVVRGGPDTAQGTAQVFLGVYSPTRGVYQVEIPGGALVSSTLSGEFGQVDSTPLDVVQGDPSRVRDMVVGFRSMRTIRAETAAPVPQVEAHLRLQSGSLSGTVRNASQQVLAKTAIVLGSSVVVLGDLAPGEIRNVSLAIEDTSFGQSLSDRILGPSFFEGGPGVAADAQENIVRHAVIDQLTFDPNVGSTNVLASDDPVLLAWGSDEILDVRIAGQTPRHAGNVLYYLPLPLQVSGPTVFEPGLVRSSIVDTSSVTFNKDPSTFNFGQGTMTVAYRPIAFDGSLAATRLVLTMGFPGDGGGGVNGNPVVPVPVPAPTIGPACNPAQQDCSAGFDGVPEVEIFDQSASSTWLRLPHFAMGSGVAVEHPERYVDPATGSVLLRFVNDHADQVVSFAMRVRIEGNVE